MEKSQREVLEALGKHGSKAAAARALNLPVSTFKDRLKGVEGDSPKLTTKTADGVKTVISSGQSIRTVEELLAEAGISTDEWEVVAAEVNSRDSGKNKSYQIKVRLKRIVPETVQAGIEHLLEGLRKTAPKVKRPKARKKSQGRLAVYGLHDAHVGMLSWGPETGGANYDLEIALSTYRNALDDLIESGAGHPVTKAIFPIGSDLFHSNDSQNRTYSGTPLDCDGRHAKVFGEGCRLLIESIEKLAETSPVHCPLVPGNHDVSASAYAACVVQAYFHNDSRVTVDPRPVLRKYIDFGKNLIGLTHGHLIKPDQLPLIMAAEAAEQWAACPYREWHIGHTHRVRETRYLSLDEQNGVRVRVNPTLCSSDYYHSSHGYVGNRRAAEVHLYDWTNGYVSTLEVRARTT